MKLLRDKNEENVCVDEHLVGDGAYTATDFVSLSYFSVLENLF